MSEALAAKKAEVAKELEKQQNLRKGLEEAIRTNEANMHRLAGALALITQMEKEEAELLSTVDAETDKVQDPCVSPFEAKPQV